MKKELIGITIQDEVRRIPVYFVENGLLITAGEYVLSEENINELEKMGYDLGAMSEESWQEDSVSVDDLYSVIGERAFDLPVTYDDSYESTILAACLKPAKHYLVFGFGMRWDGSDGYTLLDNRDDVLNRGYDVLDDILGYNGRVLWLRESSHDVPMGSDMYVIGIGERTYRCLLNSDFDEVRNFVKQSVKEIKGENNGSEN